MATKKKHEAWPDNVKVLACILVVLGHFSQSMVKAAIVSESALYLLFNQSIYFFHVPLFFICSGYLYQKYSRVATLQEWLQNIRKKAIVLGIPYFCFSVATWLLKYIFSGSTNEPIGGLAETLLLTPLPPYWYLYCLFLMFLLIPTFRTIKTGYLYLFITFIIKIVVTDFLEIDAILLLYLAANGIWFVSGMLLVFMSIQKNEKVYIKEGLAIGVLFLICNYGIYGHEYKYGIVSTVMGILGCTSIVLIIDGFSKLYENHRIVTWMAGYTMPVFLMHTLFAAPVRVCLYKLGVANATIQVMAGLLISFAGPVIAAEIMKKTVWLEFFIYPGKFISFNHKRNREQ